jgi:small-conductance mechanosensitive channel
MPRESKVSRPSRLKLKTLTLSLLISVCSLTISSSRAQTTVNAPTQSETARGSNQDPFPTGTEQSIGTPLSKKTTETHQEIAGELQGFPLTINGAEIFRYRMPIGPYSPETRAANCRSIIDQIRASKDYLKAVQDITVVEGPITSNIMLGDHMITVLSDHDAHAAGASSRRELARAYAAKLKSTLEQDLEEHKPKNLLIAAGLVALLMGSLFLTLSTINWLFPKIVTAIKYERGRLIKPLRIQEAELLSDETICNILCGSLRLFRVGIVFTIILAFVPLVLNIFPETREYAVLIIENTIEPLRKNVIPTVLGYLPDIFVIVLITAATYYLNNFIHFLFREVERGTINIEGFDREWADPTYKIVRFLTICFAFVLIFPYLPGSGSPAFQQVSIFLGVLLSLGSTGAVSHIVAGVFLTYTGAFKLGDRVRIADAVGDVVEKKLLATRIKTIKNEQITIPNGLVLSSHIINYSSSSANPGLILNSTVTIGYDAPWQDVHKALIAAAIATEDVLSTPEPFVFQTSLDDFFVSYQINAYTNKPQVMAATYSKLHQNIQDKFNEAGIEIMSPHYNAHRDGNNTTIPQNYLPQDYQAPGFIVEMTSPKN